MAASRRRTVRPNVRLHSAAASGLLTLSNGLRSAATAKRAAINAAASISTEPNRYPPKTLQREPVSMSAPDGRDRALDGGRQEVQPLRPSGRDYDPDRLP